MSKQRRFLIALFFCLLAPTLAYAAPPIVEVTSPGGIKAWLLHTDRLPLISMSFAFRGGVELDPADKQGLATLASGLLTQGAGPYDEQAFQNELAEKSITLGLSASRDALVGEVKTLARTQDEAFRLLALTLTQPRFAPDVLERLRDQHLTAARVKLGDPTWQGRYALLQDLFGAHPYAYRSLGSAQTLKAITRDDVVHFVQDHLAKDNLVVAVVGDITPEALALQLDRAFGALPAHAVLVSVPEATLPDETHSLSLAREGTQTTILFARPMMKRQDPDWHAALIANYILGGGGFASRLMNEVREKNGLTYGIGTGLTPMDKASLLMGELATDNDKAGEALALTKQVWGDLVTHGASDAEMAAAKAYLTGSQPLALSSTDAAATLLLGMQLDDLPRDYLAHREALINAVTRDDVNRVLRRWFDPATTRFVFVGKPQNVHADEERPLTKE